jgi:hypothetical protein
MDKCAFNSLVFPSQDNNGANDNENQRVGTSQNTTIFQNALESTVFDEVDTEFPPNDDDE